MQISKCEIIKEQEKKKDVAPYYRHQAYNEIY